MRAAILAVGSELLSTDRLDTNSLRLAAVLERHGVALVKKSVVGDDETALAAELRSLWSATDLVLVCGGLGPTADDVTREAAAAALGVGLREQPEILAEMERRFAALGRRLAPNNHRQAEVLEGGQALANSKGTAPGQRFERDGRTLFLFPGVPFELDELVRRELEPWLAARSSARGRERRTLKVALRPESEVDLALSPAYGEFGRQWITLLAGAGEISVVLNAEGTEPERRSQLDRMSTRVRELLGAGVYGEGDDVSLEEVVGRLLAAAGRTVATAESCTGGLIAERLTRIPGSSRYFVAGLVVYANQAKTQLAEVPAAAIAEQGAVSQRVAEALALGARRQAGADFGIGVTGIAGPEGGSAEKPVGTVHLAVAGPEPEEVVHRAARFPGDRRRVRAFAAQAALELLRRRLLDAQPAGGTGGPAA